MSWLNLQQISVKRFVVSDCCDCDLIGPGAGWVAVGSRNDSRKWRTHSETKLCDPHLIAIHCPDKSIKGMLTAGALSFTWPESMAVRGG